jgi:hypothetical protein
MNARTYDPSKLSGFLLNEFRHYGGLTAAQIDELHSKPATAQINVSYIVQAFKIAQEHGVKKPKVQLAGFQFKLAPEYGANKDAIYIIETESGFDEYLGKIMNGVFLPGWTCTQQQSSRILAAAANPFEAVVAFGKQFGKCSICNRPLSDPESVAAGVGPICRSKFGW